MWIMISELAYQPPDIRRIPASALIYAYYSEE